MRKPYISTRQSLIMYDRGNTATPAVMVMKPKSTVLISIRLEIIRQTQKVTVSNRKVSENRSRPNEERVVGWRESCSIVLVFYEVASTRVDGMS